jgi:predicted MFS family arabinose efflux permease
VNEARRPRRILPAIIVAQFAGTALWFAGNAVMPDLQKSLGLAEKALGPMTSSVQLGFIVGTLIFAAMGVADRFSPRLVFFLCALFGSGANLAITQVGDSFALILALRFFTGVALAGIYPVGMKIAASWFTGGLGAALGWLVGALVLGTALPHGIRALGAAWSWQQVMTSVSAVAALGGLLLFVLVPDGPHLKKASAFSPRQVPRLFSHGELRRAALGYFGHMWELYAFWAAVPLLVAALNFEGRSVSTWSFFIIAAGFFGCGLGGLFSLKKGSATVARLMLAGSGLCCLLAPFWFGAMPFLSLAVLILWGFFVVGDSPQFSTLVAKSAPTDQVGTALTLVNSLGFAITIPAIEICLRVLQQAPPQWALWILLPGPVLGLLFGPRPQKR